MSESSMLEYLRNKMSKINRTQTHDKQSELKDCFGQLQTHEHLNEMKIKGKHTVQRTIWPPKHTNAEHTEAI